ncbi:acetylxylan esterase [Naasia sp. SYSU D00057]|uniref:acetylxylan esterase n=1 Tax=Naasia sp. SYSU D00057 TaxID=2817380 RepID=UPI0027DCC35E|nr:acetylxylan esterase [Naasia sp. SYSU D00057]
MIVDLPEAALREYRSEQTAPDDFDAFWQETLAESRAAGGKVVLERVDAGLQTLDVFDVTFPGFGGQPIRAWLRVPRGATGPLRTVVQYVGYGGGRGNPAENLLLASAGFAHLQMDTRGQGSGWSRGETSDFGATGAQVPGVMTRGIGSPADYYYRRLFTDAVLAVDAVRTLDVVDVDRIAVQGGSQGGGIALAVAGLRDDLAAVVAFVPFLCDFPRALAVTDAYPYGEVAAYLRIHRDQVDRAMATLRYIDGVNFSRRATAPALFSAALEDRICPPSTVFGAFHEYAGPKSITVWPFNGHEGGAIEDELGALAFLKERLA